MEVPAVAENSSKRLQAVARRCAAKTAPEPPSHRPSGCLSPASLLVRLQSNIFIHCMPTHGQVTNH